MGPRRTFRLMDWWLTGALVALLGLGSAFIYSASFRLTHSSGVDYMVRQFVWIGAGVMVYLLLAMTDYRRLVAFAIPIYVFSLILLGVILLFGEARFGARRWLPLGPFTLQPSEFAKLALVLVLARYFSSRIVYSHRWNYLIYPVFLTAVPGLLILKQPDLGTALVFIPVLLGMALIGRARRGHLVAFLVVILLAAPVGWLNLKDYQKNRIKVFLNPGSDPLGSGYTVIQSKIAIGSGRLTGKGWLSGTQNMLNFLPERQTDFIFSVVAEEWGFAGALLVLFLYALVILRLYRIAINARDMMGAILVAGCLVLLAVHVLINVGMTMGLLPATGLPLPLLSYGGSVTLVIMGVLGICQSVYVHRYYY